MNTTPTQEVHVGDVGSDTAISLADLRRLTQVTEMIGNEVEYRCEMGYGPFAGMLVRVGLDYSGEGINPILIAVQVTPEGDQRHARLCGKCRLSVVVNVYADGSVEG